MLNEVFQAINVIKFKSRLPYIFLIKNFLQEIIKKQYHKIDAFIKGLCVSLHQFPLENIYAFI